MLGGGVMGANLWLMRQFVPRLLGDGRWRGGVVVGLILGKFSLFMGLLGLVFWRVPLEAVSFSVGASLLLFACLAEAVRHSWATA